MGYGTLAEAIAVSKRISKGRLREVIDGSLHETPPIPCPICHQDPRERMVSIGDNGHRPIVRRVAKHGRIICKPCAFKETAREARAKGEELTDEIFEKRLALYKGAGIVGL